MAISHVRPGELMRVQPLGKALFDRQTGTL